MTNIARIAVTLLTSVTLAGVAAPVFAQSGEVNIYSYREQSLLQPLLDQFSAETGIKANVLYAGDGLLERVAAEGELSPADVVLTVDIGNLVGAEEQGLTQPITTPELDARVPAEFRDDDDNWTALSLRARVFYVSKDRVDATALSYEDIAKPEWKGRVCTRPGDHAYNIGLIAQRIAWTIPARGWLAYGTIWPMRHRAMTAKASRTSWRAPVIWRSATHITWAPCSTMTLSQSRSSGLHRPASSILMPTAQGRR